MKTERLHRDRPCQKCGIIYAPKGSRQKYCPSCGPQAIAEAKEKWRRDRLKFSTKALLDGRKQAREFYRKRAGAGFLQKKFWVHADDVEVLKEFADALIKNRTEESDDD